MATEIQQLSDLISSSASTLLFACKENNTPFPDSKKPFTSDSEAFRANKAAADATNIIAAAALQLAQLVLPPQMAIMNLVFGHFKTAALRTAMECNVSEILREAGPEGLHADEIAKSCDVDSNKISRILRMLTVNHCYREVSPDVFANTRISSVMDSGKHVTEVLEKPKNKHDGTSGFTAFLELVLSDGAKYSSHLCENIKDPKTGRSGEPIHAPFNRHTGVNLPLFQWYEQEEQAYHRHRFALAMSGVAQMQPADILDDVIDWKALPPGSVVIDVGGGIGVSSVRIAKKNEHLECVVQDFARVCIEGKEHWSQLHPELIDTGRVTFMEHDFFTPQPVTNPSAFILKQILHDWADPYSAKILKALRAAAAPDTKLIIVDNIVAYSCHDPTIDSGLNSDYKEAPAPLLPNFGAANVMSYAVDFLMMIFLNSQERTMGHLVTLLESTGWKLISAKRFDPPSNFYEPVVAIPI